MVKLVSGSMNIFRIGENEKKSSYHVGHMIVS